MPAKRQPKYRHQKARDLAVVRIDGRDVYLGRYDSPESHEAYNRAVAEWFARGDAPPKTETEPTAPTVIELLPAYLRHVDSYYIKDDRPTSEAGSIRVSLRTLKEHYGRTEAAKFGPLALKALRDAYLKLGICRTEVNRRTSHVVRFFRWLVEHEHVPPSVYQGLKAVPGLRKGRTTARESQPIRPVADERVDVIRPHVARQVWAMVQLTRLSGMRPGEVVLMRTCDVDRSVEPWSYTPESHKTEHHDRDRIIFFGPRAREVLTPWLRNDPTEYLFSPREAEAERVVGMRERRKSKVQPSQRNRQKPGRRRRKQILGERYEVQSYHRAIKRACRKASPHPTLATAPKKTLTAEQREELKTWDRRHAWHPNQLRHTTGTKLRREFDLDTARAVLGHSKADTTEIYAERDRRRAAEVIEQTG